MGSCEADRYAKRIRGKFHFKNVLCPMKMIFYGWVCKAALFTVLSLVCLLVLYSLDVTRKYCLCLSRKKARGEEKLRPSIPSTKNWEISLSRISTSWALPRTNLSAWGIVRRIFLYTSCAYGNLYVDVDPRKGWEPNICTKYQNEYDGEPDDPVRDVDFIFTPCRDVW